MGLIILIGIATYFIRMIFFLVTPKFTDNPLIKRGLEVVPTSMLIALVIPFTFFETINNSNKFLPFRSEVYALILTVPIVYKTKKYSYGIIVAFILLILFNLIL